MKRLWLLLCASAMVSAADLSTVHSVYVLPMARGLDQFLANRLTNQHIFQVVTDFKMADAVFTDRIGDSFQTQLDNLAPPPAPTAPTLDAAKDTPKKEPRKEDTPKASGSITDTVNKLSNPALNSSLGRVRGTIFLVDTKGRQVIWSVYEPPKSSSGNDLDRTASDVVNRLKRDLNPGKKEPGR